MPWLAAGYAAFFLLTGAYVAWLIRMNRKLRREEERLGGADDVPPSSSS